MIHALMTSDIWHALETLIAVSLLIGLVLLLRRPVARHFGAGIAYMLWLIPAARLLLPPRPLPESLISLLGPATPEPAAAAPTSAVILPAPGAPEVAVQGETPALAAAPHAADAALWAGDSAGALLVAAALVWIAGAVFFAARSLLAHARFMRLVDAEAMPVGAPMVALAEELVAETGMKRPPRIVTSLISRGPFVTGLLRPVIVMPAWFDEDYTPAEARAALLHELMHVQRGDLWALQCAELFVAAMWFNPLAYLARAAFRTDQEAACDADVLARCRTSPHAYGATLVKAARLHLPEPAMATASLPLTHALKERLSRLTYPAPSSGRRLIGFGAALAFGASMLAITASVATAGEPDRQASDEFRIERNSVWVDGQATDRQIVMLGDPMSKVIPAPPVPPEVASLQAQIDIDIAEMTGPDIMGPLIALHQSEDWHELEALAEQLGALHETYEHDVVEEENGERVVKRVVVSRKDLTPEKREALAAKLEAKAAEIEAKMAAKEAAMADAERRIESKMIVLEQRIESNASEIERFMEARFEPEFDAHIEAQAALIESMVNACKDASLAAGEARIIERRDADGETFRLACVEGKRANLKSAAALAAVESHPGLTEQEKAAFRAAANGYKRKQVFVFRTGEPGDVDVDVVVHAPEPPPAPDAPELDGQ